MVGTSQGPSKSKADRYYVCLHPIPSTPVRAKLLCYTRDLETHRHRLIRAGELWPPERTAVGTLVILLNSPDSTHTQAFLRNTGGYGSS